jgi:hypothetical protein
MLRQHIIYCHQTYFCFLISIPGPPFEHGKRSTAHLARSIKIIPNHANKRPLPQAGLTKRREFPLLPSSRGRVGLVLEPSFCRHVTQSSKQSNNFVCSEKNCEREELHIALYGDLYFPCTKFLDAPPSGLVWGTRVFEWLTHTKRSLVLCVCVFVLCAVCVCGCVCECVCVCVCVCVCLCVCGCVWSWSLFKKDGDVFLDRILLLEAKLLFPIMFLRRH